MKNILTPTLIFTFLCLGILEVVFSAEEDRGKVAPFDTDIRKDCQQMASHCQSPFFGHIFLQCPKTCAAMLEVPGMVGKSPKGDDELWWESTETVRTIQGKRVATDRWDGCVTVVATVPMLPGMAPYYYEMMETLHKQYKPHVEFILIPIDLGETIHIKLRKKPGVVVLEEESPMAVLTNPFVQYLTSIKPDAGAVVTNHLDELEQLDLHTDRASFFVISSDGYFIESLISPPMKKLQRRINLFLKTVDYAGVEEL
ncbi:unnamed protein product [Cylindrotheca closterium]|uniref:Uncharacterized protein n=1 Tax=Cylindrotheca closterium TaxID=2856 RepID=A0AAD2PWM5_9STRA|nr:unnamed protein product [Cylindrotheca closterium]